MKSHAVLGPCSLWKRTKLWHGSIFLWRSAPSLSQARYFSFVAGLGNWRVFPVYKPSSEQAGHVTDSYSQRVNVCSHNQNRINWRLSTVLLWIFTSFWRLATSLKPLTSSSSDSGHQPPGMDLHRQSLGFSWGQGQLCHVSGYFVGNCKDQQRKIQCLYLWNNARISPLLQ